MERDEWCQPRDRISVETGKKRIVLCPQAKGEGCCSPWSRGSRGHWKSSGVRATVSEEKVAVGVRGEDRSRLEVRLCEQVQRCPHWSRLALPHPGSAVLCSVGGGINFEIIAGI